jgi:hypothetical protein
MLRLRQPACNTRMSLASAGPRLSFLSKKSLSFDVALAMWMGLPVPERAFLSADDESTLCAEALPFVPSFAHRVNKRCVACLSQPRDLRWAASGPRAYTGHGIQRKSSQHAHLIILSLEPKKKSIFLKLTKAPEMNHEQADLVMVGKSNPQTSQSHAPKQATVQPVSEFMKRRNIRAGMPQSPVKNLSPIAFSTITWQQTLTCRSFLLLIPADQGHKAWCRSSREANDC